MKRILAVLLCVVLCAVGFVGCGAKEDGKYTIGICQLVTHEALDAATKGFKDAVIAGLGEENVKFDEQNAANDAAMCKTITDNFATKNVDLIMANATPALQAAVKSTKKIAILGTSITEYGVALEIDNFSGTVGGNVSGTSDLAPLDKQAEMILSIVPSAKKVGLLYCAQEANSVYQVNKVKEYLEGKGLNCSTYTFTDTNDVSLVAKKASDENDALYIPTDNTAASCADAIYKSMTTKKPIIVGEAGTCKGCGVATLSIDYYDLGYATGEMAVKVLKGEAKVSEMAIEYTPEDKLTKLYNEDICKEVGIDIEALKTAGYVAIEK